MSGCLAELVGENLPISFLILDGVETSSRLDTRETVGESSLTISLSYDGLLTSLFEGESNTELS